MNLWSRQNSTLIGVIHIRRSCFKQDTTKKPGRLNVQTRSELKFFFLEWFDFIKKCIPFSPEHIRIRSRNSLYRESPQLSRRVFVYLSKDITQFHLLCRFPNYFICSFFGTKKLQNFPPSETFVRIKLIILRGWNGPYVQIEETAHENKCK